MSKTRSVVSIRIYITLVFLFSSFAPLASSQADRTTTAVQPKLAPVATAVDVVFALDNTASMSGTIDQVKADAQYIMDRIREGFPDSHFGAIRFRDYGDSFVVNIASNLTYDTAAVKAAINLMSASGGGDTPEAYTDVVYTAVNDILWRFNSVKLLVIMGDAPPHDPAYGTGTNPNGWRWFGAASLAFNNGIKVAMVAVGDGVGDSIVQESYQYMASATNGLYREAPDPATLANDLIALVNNLGATPLVIGINPVDGAMDVPVIVQIRAVFNRPIDPASLNRHTVVVETLFGLRVAGNITYDAINWEMVFTPILPLMPDTQYLVTLTSGIVALD